MFSIFIAGLTQLTRKALLSIEFIKLSVTSRVRILALPFLVLGARSTVAVNMKHDSSSVLDVFANDAYLLVDILISSGFLWHHVVYLSRLKSILENQSTVM
jgi:hypothetical protein